jgi:hypothetical protein
LPNGTNGYANTFFTPSANLTNNSTHLSFYSRTNFNLNPGGDIGTSGPSPLFLPIALIYTRAQDFFQSSMYDYDSVKRVSTSNTNSTGFYVGNRTSNVVLNSWKNGVKQATNTTSETGNITTVTNPFFIGALNLGGSPGQYSNKECAFSSIGDGLTDTEAANLYTAVQAYQTTLGRSVGTQTVSDADAQAFVNAAVIEDQVQATAINTLVTDLKGYGIWTKMKALYPFVGGTASTHKFNLKDPRDLDAAFRLVFSGGWTHSSTGATPNGTNGYADTKLAPNLLTTNNAHLSFYSRTNITYTPYVIDIGSNANPPSNNPELSIAMRHSGSTYNTLGDYNFSLAYVNATSAFYSISSRTSSTSLKGYKNGVLQGTDTNLNVFAGFGNNIYIGGDNLGGTAARFSSRQCAFATIGNGLTDTEAANLYTAVQAYQTTLSRNV